MKATVEINLPNNFNRGDCFICPYLCDLVRDDREEEKCPLRIEENSNTDEILKKIDEMINNTKELLNEFEKNERLEVKLRTLLTTKEIIQAEQKEPCHEQVKCTYNETGCGDCEYTHNINKPIETKGDAIRESNESLAKRIYRLGVGCTWCVNQNKKPCTDKFCHEGILEYLNQPLESEENMDMLTNLTPKESARIRMLIEHQEKELDRRNRLIESLTTDRDYWEREAKKYCAQIGEIRILVGQELCNK